MDSSKWLKNKNEPTNSKNNDEKCFQYALTASLNHQEIINHPGRISNIKEFINKYNCKEINFPSSKKDWHEFEKNPTNQ